MKRDIPAGHWLTKEDLVVALRMVRAIVREDRGAYEREYVETGLAAGFGWKRVFHRLPSIEERAHIVASLSGGAFGPHSCRLGEDRP